ncbi:Phospholipid/glycerol acyltransferase [gamma proteobacterium HdN1]|nr:Phospholipid/glycerol acyltransferase [gamma proteobacterium HdN1]
MDEFDAIRPFRDHEVRQVIDRLIDQHDVASVIARFRYPKLPNWAHAMLSLLGRQLLRYELRNIHDVASFQKLVWDFVDRSVKRTTRGLTVDGLERLDRNRAYLFISNHRDIVLDPALLDYALVTAGMDTAEIAIGDNLLRDPMVSDLMRLNKSFVVERSVDGLKAKLVALTRLSRYIESTLARGQSAWIAQREGRAKNGLDRTDPAVIKMLSIYGKKRGMSFAESIRHLNIVPVAISYEYDPCDAMKAAELQAREGQEAYVKADNEDIASIVKGISSPKGRVHISVGTPLTADYVDADAVAAAIDAQIVANYKLFPSNLIAYEQLQKPATSFAARLQFASSLQEDARQRLQQLAAQSREAWDRLDAAEMRRQAAEFRARIAEYPEKLQHYILEMYANPLMSKIAVQPT